MKLLLTLWILALVTEEVFPSTLVRLPRHALSKPTSSVHTEYEATYEQKGKLGNGSYSTVSGKQEVVHNNCGDNWNAFADKCASLIKDLVASLANAVSSKPGDATNLQLRIKNTLTHFDSTDNCTCLNHTKNGLSGMDLSSLFDNITINTVQPTNNNGNNAIPQTRQQPDTNDDHDEEVSGTPMQQPMNRPKLSSNNAENVDPKFADASEESLNNNSRRGAQYPQVTKNPVQQPGNSGTTGNSKQPTSGSPAATDLKKILYPTKATPSPVLKPTKTVEPPAAVVVPQSEPKNSRTSPQSVGSSPTSQQKSVPVGLPDNAIQKPGALVKPTSASQISSPSQPLIGSPSALNNAGDGAGSPSGSGLGQTPDARTPTAIPVTPVRNVVPNNNGGSLPVRGGSTRSSPVYKPIAPTAASADGPVAKPLPASSSDVGSPLGGDAGRNKTPVVAPAVSTSGTNDGGESQITPTDQEEESPEANKTPVIVPVVPTGGSDNGVAGGSPTASSGSGSPLSNDSGRNKTPVVASATSTPESLTTKSDCEEESDVKNSGTTETPLVGSDNEASGTHGGSPLGDGAGVNKTPVVVASTTGSHNGFDSHTTPSDCDEESPAEKPGTTDTPVLAPVVSTSGSQTTPSDEEDEEESPESKKTSDIKPVVSTGDSHNGGLTDSRTTAIDSDESKEHTTGTTLIPFVKSDKIPSITKLNNGEDGAAGNGSGLGPKADVEPETSSLQEPLATVSDGSTDSSPVKDSSVKAPADSETPETSNNSETPEKSQIVEPAQISSAPQETAVPSKSSNVIPGSIANQPRDERLAQKHSPEVVPVINSNSNLPESSGPTDGVSTEYPSPVYVPLPTTPTPILSSNQNPEPVTTVERGATPGLPATSGSGRTGENVPVAPASADQRSSPTAGKGGRKANENIFIVTPVPVYPEKSNAEVVKPEDHATTNSGDSDETTAKPVKEVTVKDIPNQENQPSVVPVLTAPVNKKKPEIQSLQSEGNDPQTGDDQQEISHTTPLPVQQIIPVTPIATNEQTPLSPNNQQTPVTQPQQSPVVPVVTDEQSAQPKSQEPKDSSTPDATSVDPTSNSAGAPSGGTHSTSPQMVRPPEPEDGDLANPTTFQTTSTDPTPPQKSIQSPLPKASAPVTQPSSAPQDSYEAPRRTAAAKAADDDEEEDCCSCESCTEEEMTNPKQYKEIACKDLEEARRELKAIFDKIKKKLKCGRKAPQKIVAS